MKKLNKVIAIITTVALSVTMIVTTAFAYSTGRYVVSAQYPNTRSGPGLGYSVTGQLQKGTYIDIVATDGEWGKLSNGSWVRLKGGFVSYVGGSSGASSSSSYKTGLYRVKYNGTNIRRGPSLSSAVAGRLNAGTQVTVTQVSGEWGRMTDGNWIRLNGFADYVGNTAGTSNVVTTSNQAELMVTKAQAHVGYKETGYSNGGFWSKFGDWYGSQPEIGNKSFAYAPWCAMYVSYVANEAGVSRDVIPLFASCSIGKSWFENRGRFHYRSGYTPKRGDLIFFSIGHVGIVTGVNGGRVSTIEGNVHNGYGYDYAVRTKNYNLSDSGIIGYASPAYK